eukprot:TRINITY_DN35429_c0_g1_i1.p1 TRINITY_DN35429_c0_g1~~TRINITY_DN35429_c0_g1_i1.p1  ORF type:complete len:174 (+),score=30.65 TRINITY_DN35429_c0_g1_i1:123-644(+)
MSDSPGNQPRRPGSPPPPPTAHQPPPALDPTDLSARAAEAQGLAELRTLKVGLDLRHRDVEEARRRIFTTQRQLNRTLSSHAAMRTGLRAEIEALGPTGRRIASNLEAQTNVLQEQQQSLDSERMARDALRDEARRLRELVARQPVQEGGPEVRAAPAGSTLWVENAIQEGQR